MLIWPYTELISEDHDAESERENGESEMKYPPTTTTTHATPIGNPHKRYKLI
jgi:hypothetical protein